MAETVANFIFLGSKITTDGDCSLEIKGHLLLERKVMTNIQHIKRQRYYFANKHLSSQGCGFSISHVWMWELHYKESWELKNWCFWSVVLEKTLESHLDCKEIQPVHSRAGAWGWCTGITQRDGMGREVGEGFRIGNSCTPVADSCWCMAKPIQYCKIK